MKARVAVTLVLCSFVPGTVRADALMPFDGETFQTLFDDRTQEDAFFTFDIKGGGVVSALVKAVSPLADFSFDYHDLRLTRR